MNNYEFCQKFANEHKLVFEDHGEVGFGRPCVGFLHGDNYVDWNPYHSKTYQNILEKDVICEPPPEVEDAYHKHDCLAVLVHGDDYDEAVRQLAIWVADMNKKGVEVVDYETGATGVQALFSGLTGKAVRVKK